MTKYWISTAVCDFCCGSCSQGHMIMQNVIPAFPSTSNIYPHKCRLSHERWCEERV